MLEHVYDTQFLLEELALVLNPSGQLLLTVPYHGFLKNMAIVLFRFERHFDVKGAHVRFFTRGSLENLAKEVGLIAQEFVGLGTLPYFWKSMFVRLERR